MRPEVSRSIYIAGKRYLMVSDDEYVAGAKRDFEPEMVHLFRNLVKSTDHILDVGANVGCMALLLGDLGAQVIAYEPSPSTFGFLKRNIAQAGKQNIIAVNQGLGEEPGSFDLKFDPAHRSGAFVSDHLRDNPHITIEKIEIEPLDTVSKSIPWPKIDLIKIDVEGFEGHVIRGGKETIARHKPIVVLEANQWCLNAFQRIALPDFVDFLRSVFPILLAVDRTGYIDLHNEDDTHTFLYKNIVDGRFQNVVAAFDATQVEKLRASYTHGYVPKESAAKRLLQKLRGRIG